jgi:MFS family permease
LDTSLQLFTEDNRLTDKRRAWAVMIVVFVASVAVAANRFKVPPVLPVLMDELQVDMVTGGWLMSVASVAGLVLAIPAAFVLNRIGLKRAGLIALGCAILGSAVGAVATDALALLSGRVIEGISISLMAVVAPTAISMWFEPQERGLPMGIWAAWVPVGNVVMFNAAHPIMNALGWRGVWWFGALLAFISLLLVALVVTSPAASTSGKHNPPASPGSLVRMLLNPAAWLLALAFAAFGFSLLGYNTWAPTFLTDTLHVEAAAASAYASLMFLAAIPANITAGWVINRLPNRHNLLPATFVITGLLYVWSFQLGSVRAVVPYMIALGFTSNFIPTAIFTLAPETVPNVAYAGLALAIVIVGSNLGALSGPPALGAILSSGDWAAGSIWLVLMMGVGTIISWIVSRRLKVV